MAFTDEVSSPPHTRQGMGCSVATLLAHLEGEERASFARMLDDPLWQHEAIFRSCVRNGYGDIIRRQTIGHHRRGECRCFR